MLTRADIQFVKLLQSDKQARQTHGLFVVEGAKCVGEVLGSRFDVERLLLTAESEISVPKAEAVTAKEMERISSLRTSSAELAVVRIPAPNPKPIGSEELVLALDDVQDPGNLGTIIRLADWFGIGRVVCSPQSADCYNPKVVQASMGALLRVEVTYGDLVGWLAEARRNGMEIYGTATDGQNIYDAPLSAGGVVVMGNEGHGMGAETTRLLTSRLSIPPYPTDRRGSESLNVAIAAAIVCNEFRRRR